MPPKQKRRQLSPLWPLRFPAAGGAAFRLAAWGPLELRPRSRPPISPGPPTEEAIETSAAPTTRPTTTRAAHPDALDEPNPFKR